MFALCWWGHAHQIIARIAERQLSKSDQKRITEVVNMAGLPPATTVDCSAWQDDLKSMGIYPMGNWHFSGEPILAEGYDGPIRQSSYNVTWYLEDAMKSLENPTTTSDWIWGFHMRSIIHFVGDVHTPHHIVARYTPEVPAGDNGGNFYPITCSFGSRCNNIHFYWDSVAGRFPLDKPTKPALIDEFENNVTQILDENYPKGKDLNSYLPYAWGMESFELVKKYGYSTPQNEEPTKEYEKTAIRVGSDRVALAGLRLGKVLNDLLKFSNFPKTKAPSASTSEIIGWVLDSVLFVWILFVIFLTSRSVSKTTTRYL